MDARARATRTTDNDDHDHVDDDCTFVKAQSLLMDCYHANCGTHPTRKLRGVLAGFKLSMQHTNTHKKMVWAHACTTTHQLVGWFARKLNRPGHIWREWRAFGRRTAGIN